MLGCPRSPYSLQLGPHVSMYNLLEIEIDFVFCIHSVDKLLGLYRQTVAINVFQCFSHLIFLSLYLVLFFVLNDLDLCGCPRFYFFLRQFKSSTNIADMLH